MRFALYICIGIVLFTSCKDTSKPENLKKDDIQIHYVYNLSDSQWMTTWYWPNVREEFEQTLDLAPIRFEGKGFQKIAVPGWGMKLHQEGHSSPHVALNYTFQHKGAPQALEFIQYEWEPNNISIEADRLTLTWKGDQLTNDEQILVSFIDEQDHDTHVYIKGPQAMTSVTAQIPNWHDLSGHIRISLVRQHHESKAIAPWNLTFLGETYAPFQTVDKL